MARKFYIIGNLTVDILEDVVRGGGPGYYMGLALSTLGEEVCLLGNVGLDYPRREIETLKKFKVKIERLYWNERSTTFKLEYKSDKRVLKILYEGKRIPMLRLNELAKEDVVVFSPVLREIPAKMVEEARNLRLTYALDAQGFLRKIRRSRVYNSWNPELEAVIEGCYLFHIGSDEYNVISREPLEALDSILTYNPKYVALTLGEGGSIVASRNEAYIVPVMARCEGDPTGAGDVYTGVLLSYLLRGQRLEVAASKATVAAYYKIERVEPPWYHEELIEEHSIRVLEKVERLF